MSDPEVPRSEPQPEQPEQPSDVHDVVDSANAGLADAAAAGADVPESTTDAAAEQQRSDAAADADAVEPASATGASGATDAASTTDTAAASTPDEPPAKPVDPDLAAFEEAEREHPGVFSSAASSAAEPAATSDAPTRHIEPAVATSAYAPHEHSADETKIIPSEPLVAPAPQPQPIFVQAPEPPQELNNRGAVAGIGLLATVVFALLYLGTWLGLRALAGDVTAENLGEQALAPLTTWGFWVPVVSFFIGFWLLGAIINRGRWGLWVVFGIIVGAIAYGGHLLGQLFEAPFWNLTAAEGSELVGEQLLAPLAIAAFIFGRELTIWFGAWAARSGARKTELNAEAQREYERTLEAGPTLAR